MSGGAGTRLWPLSVDGAPKQFHALASADSMLSETLRRVSTQELVRFLPPVVIGNARHHRLIQEQLSIAGREVTAVLLEPVGRNTAAVAAIAAALTRLRAPEGALTLLLPADHVMADPGGFRAAVAGAIAAARTHIVTFSIRPTGPETGYGYVQRGAPLGEGVYEVTRFAEKPSLEVATAYVADERYGWNSGIFLFAPEVMLGELKAHRPDIHNASLEALGSLVTRDGVGWLPASLFAAVPSESIDVAVMEPTRLAAVTPCDVGWADLGSWSEIWKLGPRDNEENLLRGPAIQVDTRNSLVWTDGPPIAVAGLEDMLVVASAHGVLVAPRSRAQEVKQLATRALTLTAVRSAESSTLVELRAATRRLTDWMMHAALPIWWERAADRERGGWRDALTQKGAVLETDRRCRVQARQIYVYAVAGRLGWKGDWHRAAEHGLTFLQSRYLRPDGLYRTKVTNSGDPAEETAVLYDQAFVLFGMAELRRVAPERTDLEPAAQALLAAIRKTFANPAGGFREASTESPCQSNPHMHLFEAAMAWSELSEDQSWLTLAAEIAELCEARFIDAETGVLGEHFDKTWTPVYGALGQLVEPGHQFEWAWLLERWGMAQGKAELRLAARRLFAIGVEHGVDSARGVAINAIQRDFALADPVARLWPQTERIKCAVALARGAETANERQAFYAEALRAVTGLERYLDTDIPGLWYDRIDPAGSLIEEPAPTSSFYHIVGALAELRTLAAVTSNAVAT